MSKRNQAAFDTDWLPALFNEWMRRYTEDPQKFEAEFESVGQYLKEVGDGVDPSYGESCTAYILKLCDEMSVESAA